MCGVVGVYSVSPLSQKMRQEVQALMTQAKIRGLHAFGFSLYQGRELVTVKNPTLPGILEDFEQAFSDRQVPVAVPIRLIYHNRYSTSGDYADPRNNQPIDIRKPEAMALVFNGVISQRDQPGYEAEFGVRCETANDGEVLMRKVLAGEDPAAFLTSGPMSFAGLWLRRERMTVLRNASRPLHYYRPNPNTVYFASTADIFDRALGVVAREVPINLARDAEAFLQL